MRIVRTQTYAKSVKRLVKLGARGPEIDKMEETIAFSPSVGDVIPGAGGLRKMRFAFGAAGKRGGGRTIYYVLGGDAVFMITAYAKADKSDLTADEKRLFQTLVKELTK